MRRDAKDVGAERPARVGKHVALVDEVSTKWRRRCGCADGGARLEHQLAGAIETEATLRDVDHDSRTHSIDSNRPRAHPTGRAVRQDRQFDAIPVRRALGAGAGADHAENLSKTVLIEPTEAGDHGRATLWQPANHRLLVDERGIGNARRLDCRRSGTAADRRPVRPLNDGYARKLPRTDSGRIRGFVRVLRQLELRPAAASHDKEGQAEHPARRADAPS